MSVGYNKAEHQKTKLEQVSQIVSETQAKTISLP